MKMQNDIQQHFSIRKLSIGAASVLIGISFLGAGAQTVHADTNNDTSAQEVIDNKTTASPVEKQVAEKAADADVTTEPKAEEKPVVKTEQPADKISEDAAKSESSEVKKDDKAAKDTSKAETVDKKTESPETDNQKEETKETADTEKEQVLDTKGKKPVDAKTLKEQKREEPVPWNPIDWESTKNADNDLILYWYWGGDADSITVPNEADIKKADSNSNIRHVVITKSAITSLGQHTHNLAMSGTDGQKVYATGDMRSAFHSGSNNWHTLDLTNLDVSGVTNMLGMISNQHELTSVGDLSNWDTRNVTNMAYLFNDDPALTGELDVSN